jgi:hypothetical protein
VKRWGALAAILAAGCGDPADAVDPAASDAPLDAAASDAPLDAAASDAPLDAAASDAPLDAAASDAPLDAAASDAPLDAVRESTTIEPADTSRDDAPTERDAPEDAFAEDGGADAGEDAGADTEIGFDTTETDATGEADASGEADAPSRPSVVSSDPAEGTTGFYPDELYDRGPGLGIGIRRVLRVEFDRAMDTTATTAALVGGGSTRSLPLTWSSDARTAEALVLPSDEESPALLAGTSYALDLRTLRSVDGALLDPAPQLVDGRLDFRTSDRDETLNHTCQHALYGPFATATATSSAAAAPNTNSVHRFYTVSLPPEGTGFGGYTRFRATGSQTAVYTFFFARPIAFAAYDEALKTDATIVASGPTPPACAGIGHFARVRLVRGNPHALRFGPTTEGSTRFVIEPP